MKSKIKVFQIAGEHDDRPIVAEPNDVVIQVADFADCLSIEYKNVTLHFDMGKIKDCHKLVDILVESFVRASDDRVVRLG